MYLYCIRYIHYLFGDICNIICLAGPNPDNKLKEDGMLVKAYRIKRISRMIVLMCVTGLVLLSCNQSEQAVADLVLINGHVVTMDSSQTTANALAVSDNTIMEVGSKSEIRSYIGDQTKVLDLEGSLALPGFIDNHTHFERAGELLLGINLLEVSDEQGLIREVKAARERLPESAWIVGGQWGAYEQWERDSRASEQKQDMVTESFQPHRSMIDSVTTDNPVLLSKWDGSEYLANTQALEEAGANCSWPGVRCDNDGNMTGQLEPGAAEKIRDIIPEKSREQHLAESRIALERLREHGVTTIHDITGSEQMSIFQELKDRDELTVRVYARPTLDKWEQLADVGIEHGFGDEWLKIGGLKGFVDGIMGNSSARFYEPYLTTGELGEWRDMMYPPGNMRELLVEADKAGHWPQVHAIGDHAVDSLLTLYEHVIETNKPKDRRFRVIHTQVLSGPEVADRMADMDIIAEVQPYHAIDDMRWMEERIGERSRWAYAFKTLEDAGVMLSFGSDWPGTNASWYTSDPLMGIYASVTRQNREGEPDEGWYPQERVSLDTALRAYTVNNAYAAGEENIKGSLTPGKLADIVVLSKDITSVNPSQLPETEVLYTIVDGNIVYQKYNE